MMINNVQTDSTLEKAAAIHQAKANGNQQKTNRVENNHHHRA